MKQIKIQHYTLPDKDSIYTKRRQYLVSLGNGYSQYFGNQKEVIAFLTEPTTF